VLIARPVGSAPEVVSVSRSPFARLWLLSVKTAGLPLEIDVSAVTLEIGTQSSVVLSSL
jgi:hypothetical protein